MSIDYGGVAALLSFAAFAVFVGILMGSKSTRHFLGHCLRATIFDTRDGMKAAKETVNGGFEAVSGLVKELKWGRKQ